MMKPKLPEGMNEEDYDAIEAAVMETVRGRWFLAEFARRSHVTEMRQMLDAVARLEQVVTANQAAPADPSVRLLVSRLKEVGEGLALLVGDMRADSIDEKYCDGVEAQARALGGLLRLNGSSDPGRLRAPLPEPRRSSVAFEARTPASVAPLPASPAAPEPVAARSLDEKFAALAAIDALSTLEKMRLFR